MADSACLIRGFSYASATPNDAKLGNCMHSLGESISFGRFMSEPLGLEKWSSFSTHRKYVEEAESYAQPGSVAQKKAFFEAHFKRIAAQRAAIAAEEEEAQAAALLLNKQIEETQQSIVAAREEETTKLLDSSHDHEKKKKISTVLRTPTITISKENTDTNLIREKKKSCSKSLWSVMNAGNAMKEPYKDLYPTNNKGESLTTPKSLGLTTPAQTPQCDDRRKKTASDFSASGNKTGTKWHKLSSVCSKSFTACRNRLQNTTLATPFVLRTAERAAIRKQKLEEKFIACDTQTKTPKTTTLKVKAGKELRKLSNSFCFKSTTLPPAPPPVLHKENLTPPKKATKRGGNRLFRDPLLEKNVKEKKNPKFTSL